MKKTLLALLGCSSKDQTTTVPDRELTSSDHACCDRASLCPCRFLLLIMMPSVKTVKHLSAHRLFNKQKTTNKESPWP